MAVGSLADLFHLCQYAVRKSLYLYDGLEMKQGAGFVSVKKKKNGQVQIKNGAL